jgi:glycosyltransferase involved in cell wall biosynthesis
MRVINFISGKDLGGPKQSFILYSEVLLNLGFQVNSVIRQGAPLKEIMQSMDIDVDEVSYIRTTHPLFIKKSIQNLRKALLPMNASVIFVHKQLDIELVRGALGNNAKIIGIIHGFNANHIEHADMLISVSEKVRQFLIDSGCDKPIYVVPNMVKIGASPTYRDLPKAPLIGAMGVFRRKKGFHMLIKALSILKQRNIPFKAIIAGKGRITWYLKYLRWKLDLTHELTMRDWVSNEERDEFIDSIDLYVLPSRTETFGMVVVEAMARMKRVIATKCGGPEEIISDGVDGFLVEKENPKAMAAKLELLITNHGKSTAVPSEAHSTAIEKYSTEKVAHTLSEILNKDLNYNDKKK